MIRNLLLACIAGALCAGCTMSPHLEQPLSATAQCPRPATWYIANRGTLQAVSQAAVLERAARRNVVLLGEHHDDPDHHLWQLQTLAALKLLRSDMVIGFEAFPRPVQPVLDDWVAGRLTETQFLERVQWEKIWNVPAALYLPLFHFARLNRIPMAALNVDRTLTAEISRKGWDAVPAAHREGVSRPAAASSAYADHLFEAYKQHAQGDQSTPSREDAPFRRFVEAQTTWDRAMAEAIANRVRSASEPRPLVIGIMGSGHVQHGYGVPHQLRDLGINDVTTLLPLEAGTACGAVEPALADAVFAIPVDPRDKPVARAAQ